jgi:hypothetical protein
MPDLRPAEGLARPGLIDDRPVRSARTGPRRHAILSLDAVTPGGPIDVDDFQELRRQGLFDDCGRNPPPSWWAR